MPVRPVLQALLIADNVYTDGASGKRIIAGTFDHFTLSRFPGQLDNWSTIYVSLTEIHKAVPLTLKYVDLSNDHVLAEWKLRVQAPSRLASADATLRVPPLPLPHPGAYALEVFASEGLLGSLRITAELTTAPAPPGEPRP
jgi:hypothetical protein